MTTASFDLQRVQKIRKAVMGVGILAVVTVAVLTRSAWGTGELHEGLEALGLGMIALCIVGRAWCSLYIGGRKKAEIVDRGPYSVSRNPLYVFSFIGAFGVGAQTGSLSLALLFLALTVVVFWFTVRREEAWLNEAFGAEYASYRARTPRFGLDFSKWRDDGMLEVRPRFFLTTIRDGLVFLLAVPLFESVEHLQNIGWLAPLLHLP
ncbi:methyltransferase family protein [Brevundimonas lenta]|uniref:Protein-S-isoprenylcysteine O-methyltransferase Ste14 n=1 Tax=Brevundimonas lenta TaxID=424796 RepID=A0A7W6JDW4_9CAUL|nr:isoprenylcysteine carboxylmethyltransferase family protein [Brevundimonas lenta]MBB4083319.1 protein-S-isoprenylcysteine O-methyltransferase Ste14 [Brevundimonas lenta]